MHSANIGNKDKMTILDRYIDAPNYAGTRALEEHPFQAVFRSQIGVVEILSKCCAVNLGRPRLETEVGKYVGFAGCMGSDRYRDWKPPTALRDVLCITAIFGCRSGRSLSMVRFTPESCRDDRSATTLGPGQKQTSARTPQDAPLVPGPSPGACPNSSLILGVKLSE